LTLIDSLLNTVDPKMQINITDLPSFNEEYKLQSWVKVPADSHFPIQNIPFGVFEKADGSQRIGVRIGDYVLDLYQVASLGLFALLPERGQCLKDKRLNSFMSYDRSTWTMARHIIQYLLSTSNASTAKPLLQPHLYEHDTVTMLLPCRIGDYTDFYSSRNHATNVGIMFRGKDNALQPNWLHLPVGYHGRASSVVVSDTPVRRPCGQLKKDITDRSTPPSFGPCRLLDIELEVGFFYGGKSNHIGNPIRISDAYDHVFGMVLMNDWSARDIQKWEYIPLGPFNGKNFCTTISPWIVTMDALQPLRLPLPKQEPTLLPYLCDKEDFVLDVDLSVLIQSNQMKQKQLVCSSNTKHLYYSCHQQLAHHTVTGCPFNAGDLLGSGTISGTEKKEFGSFLELSWAGKQQIQLDDGSTRKFLQDGDKITITGSKKAKNGQFVIGFGECNGVILPAHDPTLLGKL